MATEASGNLYANLARLDEEAARAGCALACIHQSADELHRAMVQRYLALRPRRRNYGFALGVSMLAAFLILL